MQYFKIENTQADKKASKHRQLTKLTKLKLKGVELNMNDNSDNQFERL
jgi:hypothetical protein